MKKHQRDKIDIKNKQIIYDLKILQMVSIRYKKKN